jgi:hypothetical protein
MKQLAILLFLFASQSIQGQVIEEFSDGNLSSNPTWMGDLSQFNINSNYQLQLNSSGSDSSYMSFNSPLNSSDSLQWEILVQQSFSPSSQNYGRIYLTSDNPNLEQALNGYYLQLGESGSNDAIALYKQTGYNSSLICRGTDAAISSAFTVRIKVTKTGQGNWKIYSDYSGGTNYNEEASGTDNSISTFIYFGIKDVYTSSNATKFYYDYIYAGEYIADTLNPFITSFDIIDSSHIRVNFSEKIRNTDANNIAHFYIDGNMVIASAQDSDLRSVVITSGQTFTSPNTYQLMAYQIHDLEGNLTTIDSINFQYLTTELISVHDLIISEIMSDPSGANNLPNAEYIEIFNRSQKYINSTGFILTDGSTDAILPNDTIEPGGYRVYFNQSHLAEFQQFQIPNTKGLSTFPGLNNDGDHITLKDAVGNIIDKINYTLASYHDAIKQSGGWSIERKDVEFTCSNEENWQASKNNSGGTPGTENSEKGIFIDDIAPDISYITVTDSLNIEIHYSEVPEIAKVLDIANYSINKNNSVQEVKIIEEDELAYKLLLMYPLQRDQVYEMSVANICDCAGNKIKNTNEFKFGLGEECTKNDLLINEILFNPGSDQHDYIELFNNSSKIISLANMKLAQNDFISGEIKSANLLTTERRVICPGEYLVICESTAFLSHYSSYNIRCGIQASTPSMNDDEGIISLLTLGMEIIDQFHYTDKMQYPLLAEIEGVALERISPKVMTNITSNWHSASYQSGYGTPSKINSQAIETSTEVDSWITITPAIISPDNDGHSDLSQIKINGSTGTGTIQILNENGKKIKVLAEGEYMGTSSEFIWDGANESGTVVPVGIYIVIAEITKENGETLRTKKPIVIAQHAEKIN